MSLIYLSLCSIIINERWGEVYWREGGGKGGQSGPRKFTGEVYWGSLPGNKAPVDFLQGLTGGGWGRKGKGGRGQSPPPYFSRKYGGGCVLAAGPPPYFRQNIGGNDLTTGGGLSLPSPRPYRLTGASTLASEYHFQTDGNKNITHRSLFDTVPF